MKNNSQQTLFDFDVPVNISNWKVSAFSADNFCSTKYREELESKYFPLVEVTDKFSRQTVSYQASKKVSVYRWLKYKEGFSCDLVDTLLNEMNIRPNDTILDPFLGSGTTAFACNAKGINCIGYDILPMSKLAVNAKSHIMDYDLSELHSFISFIKELKRPISYQQKIPEITITKSAYPVETSYDLSYFKSQIIESKFSYLMKNLGLLALTNSLERLSYTAKDGQYLRWDFRSEKTIKTNSVREKKGKPPLKVKLNKGLLPNVNDVLLLELENYLVDIENIQNSLTKSIAHTTFFQNSVLRQLPLQLEDSINGVITSPPYCNRYDYTRIYALELVFLGKTETEINSLRQDLLSCTVESKSKRDFLRDYYATINRKEDYNNIIASIDNNQALSEVMLALEQRTRHGDVNNKGILKMIKGYFDELAFVYYELYKACKNGAQVAFVNDNVRYAGEIIPVDFISSNLAELFGFKIKKIYTLRQQKGNSSQQMKKFGRVPLRKSITIWEK